ncbi:hypothetical protein MRX96_004251 [Rhipicephalus microplus]
MAKPTRSCLSISMLLLPLSRAPAPEAAPRPAPGAARPTGQDPTPPSGGKGKSYLTWADRARGNQAQASNSQDSHDPRLTNELKELRRANDSLRKENAQFKQEISRLATEIAEIRKLALKPPAPPAATRKTRLWSSFRSSRRPSPTYSQASLKYKK